MGTITVNVDEEVEKRFRKNVQLRFGRCKGALGKAVSEAFENWNRDHVDLDHTLNLLESSVDRGGYMYLRRDELHDRN